MVLINKDFKPKRSRDDRLPPGQYKTTDFPVLSLGPTPQVDLETWTLEVSGLVGKPQRWTWVEFAKLPMEQMTRDIHCVTKWSKFDTEWKGVSLDTIMERADSAGHGATTLIAHSYDGYTTNLPIEDIRGGRAMVATAYKGNPISAEHGGPARLLVPHLYFWKSAKWLKKLEFVSHDMPGFWETRGYHNYGDPWREQRYTND